MKVLISGMQMIFFMLFPVVVYSQVPAVLNHIEPTPEGNIVLTLRNGTKLTARDRVPSYTYDNLKGQPAGTEKGIVFDFRDTLLYGRLYVGLINYNDSKYPLPVYRSSAVSVNKGKAAVNFDILRGNYDMTGWEDTGIGTLGYRVVNRQGEILYDGKVSFTGTGPFRVVNTLLSGPFVNMLTDHSAVISFETSEPEKCKIFVEGKAFTEKKAAKEHEISLDKLKPDQEYTYKVVYGNMSQSYTFHTAPAPGTRKPFVFGYASDSRGGAGGGERNLFGTNAYISKRIGAAAASHHVVFLQFTGDLINGYGTSAGEMWLEYTNWKTAVEPFAHHFPVIAAMGNHEVRMTVFYDSSMLHRVSVDRFPYATASAEELFSRTFVNPLNGPESEDGATYDPDPHKQDFPGYKENVYYYTYDNVAIICLNADYWYTPSVLQISTVGGCPHGYIMDRQLEWFGKVLRKLEKNDLIDHIFVTVHTPFFPNSAHVDDDMWYGGNNSVRAWVAGNPLAKGIIERRDQLLDLAVNKSKKVVALLTGDEHNYCKTEIGPDTPLYPQKYFSKKIKLTRTIYQINNGAAGAPYYAQATVPWTPYTTGFTTQNALCLFYVNGKHVLMKVINPDTMDEVDSLKLR